MAYETPYIDQWLKTATKGNVVSKAAWFQDRLQFRCTKCDMSLTTSTDAVKADGTVDYGLQEFVKIHSHVGGHNDPKHGEPGHSFQQAGSIPMTADFKKIDLKPEKEQAIKAKLDAYNTMMEKALDDKALALKIKQLQEGDKGKSVNTGLGKIINVDDPKKEFDKLPAFKPLPMKGGEVMHPFEIGDIYNDPQPYDDNGGPWNPATDVDAELAKTKAIENILKIKEMQNALQKAQQIEQHRGTTIQTQPAKVKDKVLTQPTGRKFR